jgi:hypothetical protein
VSPAGTLGGFSAVVTGDDLVMAVEGADGDGVAGVESGDTDLLCDGGDDIIAFHDARVVGVRFQVASGSKGLIPSLQPFGYFVPPLISDLCVDRGVGDVRMSEVILHDCDVLATVQHSSCATVPQRMEVRFVPLDFRFLAVSFHEDIEHLLGKSVTPAADEDRSSIVTTLLQPGAKRFYLGIRQ